MSRSAASENIVFSPVERGGTVRSFHPAVATKAAVVQIVEDDMAEDSRFMSNESRLYTGLPTHAANHRTTQHAVGEYVRFTSREVQSNTVENTFSVLKRGIKGASQH